MIRIINYTPIKSWLFVIITLITISSCSKPHEETLFKLLDSKETGIEFRNDLVSSDEMNILEYLYFYNGGGVATGDINNDGFVDIYFTSNQGENKLYLNKGNFKFEDITSKAAVTGDGGWSTGVTMADVNGEFIEKKKFPLPSFRKSLSKLKNSFVVDSFPPLPI